MEPPSGFLTADGVCTTSIYYFYNMDWISALIAIVISLVLIGFFSGIEIAFISANKLSIELRKKQGYGSGKIWGEYADKPAKFIGTTLVCFNIILVVYGLLWSTLFAPVWKMESLGFLWKRFNAENPYLRLDCGNAGFCNCVIIYRVYLQSFLQGKK